MNAYKQALDELTVPSRKISKGRCYVEYRAKFTSTARALLLLATLT